MLLPGMAWLPIMMPQLVFQTFWQSRAGVLGKEFTYPVSRHAITIELGTVILLAQFLSWSMLALAMAATALLLGSELPGSQLGTVLLISGAWQLLAFGLAGRLAGFQSLLPLVLSYILNMLVGVTILALCLHTDSWAITLPVTAAILLAALPMLAMAYKYWLTADIA